MHKFSVPYTIRGDFYRSLDRLMKIRVDAFIGNHVSNNNGMAKAAAKKISYSNPYINPDDWRSFLKTRRGMLDKVIREEHDLHFVTYAHRGASEYCPENTMLSFYTGMYMGANGIETDVHKTRDGVCVLFHDDTLERVCGVEGRIEDYTYEELQAFDVIKGDLRDKIPTLDDFLAHFKNFRAILAIELKGADCERDVADIIRRHGVEKRVIVTSFHLDYLKKIKEYYPALRIGYLTKSTDDETVGGLLEIGGEQICPLGDTVTPELVEKWHGLGLDVRAWGISHKNYKSVYDAGVDGMTANFPDLVLDYIKKKRAAAE